MIVQHRLIGNIPGRGHGDPLLSSAFPLDSELTTTTAYRAPDPGLIPAQAGRISEDGKYHVLLTTFEIQATHFGRSVLVSANVFRPVNAAARPMIYMNTVAMTDESGAPMTFLPTQSLLGYGDFMQPAQFAALNAASKALSSTPWSPAAPVQRKPFFAPDTAAHRALLGRYWAAASSRMFGKGGQTLSVCLGQQSQCTAIIEGAKALLLCDILPYLPKAVSYIASMSAGILEASVRGVFKDSALAVVFPTDPTDSKQPAFDLRRKDGYPTLSPLEDQFIASVLSGNPGGFMKDVVSRYMRMTGCTDEAQISFAADYDFSLLLYQLERSVLHGEALLPASGYVNAWKQLNAQLISRHHLTLAQVNELLAGVEERLMPAILNAKEAVASVDASALPPLWEKALTVQEPLFPAFARVIAACPAAPSFPQMIEAFPHIGSAGVRRTAQLIAQLTNDYYAGHPLTSEPVARMTAEPFAGVVSSHPEIGGALRDMLRRNNAAFPDNLLVTLPLGCMLDDGRQALLSAAALLRRAYVAQLPPAEDIQNLEDACARFADAETEAALCGYFAACLPQHLAQLTPLAAMLARVMPRTDEALCSMLDAAEQSGILLDVAQIIALFGEPMSRCADPARLAARYAAYEGSVSAKTGEQPMDRLSRLCESADTLRAIGFDATAAVTDMLSVFVRERTLFTPAQSSAFVGRLWPLCTDRSRIAAAFHDYLLGITQDDPLYYFNHTEALRSLTPFIDANRTDMTKTVCGILESIAVTSPCAPAAQLGTFFEQLLPQCADRERVSDLFFDYIGVSVQSCMDSKTDAFPWLEQIQALCARHALKDKRHPSALTELTLHYLCDSCAMEKRPPSAAAFDWLQRLAAQQGNIFSAAGEKLLSLYDMLLTGTCAKEAAAQMARLLAYFGSTAGYKSVCALDQQEVCAAFCQALEKAIMDEALSAVQRDMRRCGLSEEALLASTKSEAEKALRREFSELKNLTAFEQAYRRNAASAKDRLYNDVLAAVFGERTAKYMESSRSLENMEQLNAVARVLGCPVSGLPDTIRLLAQTITKPGDGAKHFSECLSIISRNSVSATHILRELGKLIDQAMPGLSYPQAVYAAMLCSLSDGGKRINWEKMFEKLGMPIPQKLPQPYSPQGQAYLAAIHAVCKTLDALAAQPGLSYGPQFIQYLNRDAFEDFSMGVVSNAKRLGYFFPDGVIQSSLMRQWLET